MRDANSTAIFKTEPRSVLGIDQRNASRCPFGQDGEIVHPAIVAVELASPHNHKFGCRSLKVSRWTLEIANEHGGRKFNLA
jgi:hypothetical protein